MIVRSNTFGSNGLPAGQNLKVQTRGFVNPKEVNTEVAFSLESFDESERLIDKSSPSAGFTIIMRSAG